MTCLPGLILIFLLFSASPALCRRPGCGEDQSFPIGPCKSLYNGGGQVTLLLSEQDVNLVGDNLKYQENAATKLLRVIIAFKFSEG